jgi:hypothetical protein
MSPLLAHFVEINPAIWILACVVVGVVVALALGIFLWLTFRKWR